MGISNLILLGVALIAEVFLLSVIARSRAYLRFPLFSLYVAYSIVGTSALAAMSPYVRIYSYAFWVHEAAAAVLAVLSLHELFKHVFTGFYSQFAWFRVLFPGVIATALISVIWSARDLAPVRGSFLLSVILMVDLAVNFAQIGLFVLFVSIARTFRLRWRYAPMGILLGFTFYALGNTLTYWAVPVFGTGLQKVIQYVPPVAYILALVVWLDTFLRPERDRRSISAATLRQVAQEIRQDTQAIKEFLERR